MSNGKFTWKKIPVVDPLERNALLAMGCPEPGSTECYSYLADSTGQIRYQRCVDLAQSLNAKGRKQYRYIQHYTIDFACPAAQEVLCVRTPHDLNYKHRIVTRHKIGECPLCNYHSYDEYLASVRSLTITLKRSTR